MRVGERLRHYWLIVTGVHPRYWWEAFTDANEEQE
jgi:hypothetical protein